MNHHNFRLGNIIMLKNKQGIFVINGIVENGISVGKKYQAIPFSEIIPITLDADWIKNKFENSLFTFGDFHYLPVLSLNAFEIHHRGYALTTIEYLHEYQNLYYQLKGEELKPKPYKWFTPN